MTFDPGQICRILNEEQVDYVVVGGLAAVLLGSPLPTEDIDILPSREGSNLERLARALARMGAKIRTAGDPVPAPLDAQFLSQMPFMLNLVTEFGILDLTFDPAGPRRGYGEWDRNASTMEIADQLSVRVASLEDIIDSKRAANRPKDIRALPFLESLRDTLSDPD